MRKKRRKLINGKHLYSTYAIIGFMFITVLAFAISELDTNDIDDVCSTNNAYLKRLSGSWVCSTKSYGELFVNSEKDQVIGIAVQNTYYNVSGLNQTGELNNFNTDGNVLQNEVAGTYLINLMTSFSGGGSTEYEIELFVNGVQQTDCSMHRKMGTGGDVGSGGFSCLKTLSALDLLQIKVVDNNNPPADITIHSLNFNAVEVS